jgi:hypothetical protein
MSLSALPSLPRPPKLFQKKTYFHRHFPTFVDKFPTYVKKIGLLAELTTLLYDLII